MHLVGKKAYIYKLKYYLTVLVGIFCYHGYVVVLSTFVASSSQLGRWLSKRGEVVVCGWWGMVVGRVRVVGAGGSE